ncbi:YitT family protein, partial [Anaerospora hongkongensis]
MPQKRNKVTMLISKYVMLFLGSILAAVGVEEFLVPNQIIDGGIVGISIMLSHITGFSLSAFLIVLNL